MAEPKGLKDLLYRDDWQMGIGDVARATGVSQTQLRYWEEKGFIKSMTSERGNKNRKFSFFTLIRVRLMKHFIDEGFTLASAARQADEHNEAFKTLKTFIKDRLQAIVEMDGKPAILLGKFDPDPTQDVYVLIDGDHTEFKLQPNGAE